MRIIITIVAVIIAAGLYISGVTYAAPSYAEREGSAIVDADNKICPVTGEKVDGKTTYVYNGKRYNLCCPMCPGIFANDPVKYSKVADKEVAAKEKK